MVRPFKTTLCIFLFLQCLGCTNATPNHSDFEIGVSRKEITNQFGKPVKITRLAKTTEHIWGAIESYWYEVPIGSEIEIWVYRSKQKGETTTGASGETQLYFLNGSNTVTGVGFHGNGAVY